VPDAKRGVLHRRWTGVRNRITEDPHHPRLPADCVGWHACIGCAGSLSHEGRGRKRG